MAGIREYASGSTGVLNLDSKALQALKVMQRRICAGPPRKLPVDIKQKPVLVFTDGAYEPEGDPEDEFGGATIGGVIIVPGSPQLTRGLQTPRPSAKRLGV